MNYSRSRQIKSGLIYLIIKILDLMELINTLKLFLTVRVCKISKAERIFHLVSKHGGFMKLIMLLAFSLSAMSQDLSNITNWGYHLHTYNTGHLAKISSSQSSLWVIDYSKDGTTSKKFSKNEIRRMKGVNNVMISYFCLGEAEEVRYYWDKMDKSVIIKPNPHFPDNHIVKFWEDSWQQILVKDTPTFGKSYLNRIIELGFDGVYLDTVDDFEIYTDPVERKLRAKQMAELVRKISIAANKVKPGFKIILQNATSFIYELDNPYDELFAYTHAFGIESLFYRGSNYENNPLNPDKWVMDEVRILKNKYNQKIFNVEYIMGTPENHKEYKSLAAKEGLIPLISTRELDGEIITNNQI